MAKQLNVSLNFQANTSQAKTAIQDLQMSLSKISMGKIDANIDPTKIKSASAAAKELSIHLNNAYNADTGKLDLSRLDRSLKTSGQNIKILSTQLLNAGVSGEQAFVKLAQNIAAADRPLITLSSKLKTFGTTLANTAKWQISSSILHGFMGAVQKAYGYAQNLNESLNNIRIVTGQNTEQMAKFAEQANKAAKSLSTSTTDYTKASLIYYQQGLSDQEVLDRTNVTIKMANVAGQSAETVSDQLTAVWNNFAKGGENLEYYADVMTALGAATASSTDEIAQGLEKFAAVSDTVGLSYEYATSALATVTATTRQSADVVGTAFKTLFARIEGLKLGETLDDGTTLNQYSEALMAIGVNIKDSNGELKNMDTILNEMAGKWETLNKDEQVALAQKVAGIRQYTQLIALMDNWDFMEENLATAKGASGTLEEQQKIYEESWEAANQRVKASMEAIYSDLLDDEFFIDITNGFSGLIDSIDAFIDGAGGIKIILMGIGSMFLSTIAHQIQPALLNLKHTFSIIFSSAQKQAQSFGQEMNSSISQVLKDKTQYTFTDSSETALQNALQLNNAKSKLQSIEKNLTSLEKQRYQQELSLLQIAQDETQEIANKITKRKEEIAILSTQIDYAGATKDLDQTRGKEEEALRARRAAVEAGNPMVEGDTSSDLTRQIIEHSNATDQLRYARETYVSALYKSYSAEMETTSGSIEKSQQQYSIMSLMPDVIQEYSDKLANIASSGSNFSEQINIFKQIKSEIDLIVGDSIPELSMALSQAADSDENTFVDNIEKVKNILKEAKIPAKELEKILKSFGQGKNVNDLKLNYKSLGKDLEELRKKQDSLNKAVKDFNPTHTVTGIEKISKTAAGLGQVAMVAQSVRSIFQAWSNDDLSFGEKLTTTFMSISMIVPSVIGAFKSLNTVLGLTAGAQAGVVAATVATLDAKSAELAVLTAEQIVEQTGLSLDAAKVVLIRAKTIEFLKHFATREAALGIITAEQLAETTGMTIDQAKIVITKLQTGATLEAALAEAGLTGAKTLGTFATIAQTIAQKLFNMELGVTGTLIGGVVVALAAFLAAMAAVALIITGVVAGIKALNNKLHEDSIAAKEAAEHADLMAEKYNKLAEEANKFKEAVNNYDTAVESLKKLEKGTDEYKEALEKANEEAIKLIELYGLWDKVKGYDENGLIIFEDNALADGQKEKDAAANDAKWESDAAKIGSIYKTIEEITNQIIKDIGGVIADGKKKGKQNSTITNFRQLDKNEIGEIAGVFGQIKNIKDMDDEALTEFLENSNSLSSHLKNIIPCIVKNREAFENLSKVLDDSASELEFKTKGLISGTLDKQFGSQIDEMSIDPSTGKTDDGRRAQILNAAATGLYQNELNKENNLASQLSNIDVKSVTTNGELNDYDLYKDVETDEDLARKYAEVILGKSADEVKNYQYVKGTGEGGLKDANGQEILKTTDDKYMRRRLAQHAEEQKIKDSYETNDTDFREQYMSALEDLVKGGDTLGAQLGADITGALLESLQSGTETLDLSSIFGGLNSEEVSELKGLSASELVEKLGMTPEKLQALGFESAEAFEAAFDSSLEQWTPELAKKDFLNDLTSKTSEDAGAFGLDPEMIKEVAEGFADMAEAGAEGYEGLDENAELASDAATRYVRLQNAVLDLADNYDDYADVLAGVRSASNKVDKSFAANSENGKKLKKSLAGLLGTTEDLIDADLLAAIDPDDFKAAAAGDEAAIKRIRDSFIKLQAEANGIDFTGLKNEIDGLKEGADLNLGIDSFLSNLITAKLNAGATATDIESMLSGFGIDMDTINFYDDLAAAQAAAEATGGVIVDNLSYSQETTTEATEVEKNGTDMGFTESIQTTPVPVTNEVTETDADGNISTKSLTSTVYAYTKTVEENPIPTTTSETVANTESKVTNGAGKTGSAPPKKYAVVTGKKSVGNHVSPGTQSAAQNKGGGGGGGGSKPKKNKKTRKDEVVERYKEVNDQIDDAQRKMKQAEKAAEGLWGPNRLKEMKKVREALKEELKLLKQKAAENAQYLEEDRAYLQEVAAKNGAQAFTFDANGNISNYDEVMGALYAELAAAENAAGDTVDENEQKIIDAIKERIEEVEGAIGIYDTTKEELEDSEDAIKEWVLQIQDAYLNELNYEFEIKAVVDDSELAKLDYYLGKMDGGSIWDMYEAGALMIGTGKHQGAGQMQVYEGQLEDYETRYNKLLTAYTTIDPETGERQINQEQFIKELSTLQTEIYGTLNNLNAMDESMKHYYGDTLAAASEELSKYTDLMDNHTAVLEHYGNLINLLGKSKDFDKMSHVLKAQVEVSKNAAEVSRANYEMLRAEADDKRKAWEAAQKDSSLSEYEKSVIEQQWIDAETAAGEAQDQMLSDAEAWAEALVAQLENDLAGLADTLETNLAGDFGSLSNLTESLERANSLQEEYLTTTNKIYETNKLMNQAQQEIDKTSNAVSKRRLKQFITETEQLQSKNKLSQFELDIRQAEYEILLAELALEEAQSAKSTVRLQRDSEGNFGYVYTADTSEVDKAQQNLEDAQNALYNISLEGANKYTESYIQTIQEMNDKITELTTAWQNGEIESKKEYDARMLELQEYYGEKLAQYSNLQQIALTTDSRVIDDAWSKDFFHMTTQTELWMSHVDTYVEGVSKAFEDYDLGMAEVEEHVSEYLGNIEKSTGKIVDKNEALEKSITDPNNGLLKALGDEISKVNSLTAEYLELRKAIQGTISDSESLGDQIASDIAQESDGDESNDYQPTGTGESESGDDNGSDNSNNDNSDDNNKKEITVGGQVRADGAYIYDAPNDDPETQVFKNDPVYTVVREKGDWVLTRHHSLSSGNTGWFKKSDLVALDTGGYTGDWAGSYGKLALLHKKELILDQEDTINFLQSIEAMERILSTIDLQAANAQYIGNILSPTVNATKERETLEQNVHIEASFPNAVNHNEIQEAFENIVNLASQYANKK